MIITEIQYFFSKIIRFQAIFKDTVEFTCALEFKISSQRDKRIVFTGYVYGQEIQELYSNSYIFALPSNLEGMANALLEAMSYGNCCLISDIPENTEVVHEKAMWFEKENAKDLQKKLQMLLNDSELVKKYKTEAAPYILERYSWDIVVDQMLRVYAGDVVDYDTVLRERECGSGEKA